MLSLATFLFSGIGAAACIFALVNTDLAARKLLRYSLVGTLLLLSLIVLVFGFRGIQSRASGPSDARRSAVPIAIEASKDWQASGVVVDRGDRVTIRVVGGLWIASRTILPADITARLPTPYRDYGRLWWYGYAETAGAGDVVSCASWHVEGCPVPSGNIGALVGRIENGDPFVVGPQKSFVASDRGYLQLRINDGVGFALADNSGVLAVDIVATPE